MTGRSSKLPGLVGDPGQPAHLDPDPAVQLAGETRVGQERLLGRVLAGPDLDQADVGIERVGDDDSGIVRHFNSPLLATEDIATLREKT